jgi:succinate dehydrogenase / fumarate reductase flavoprotein subunit
MRIFPALHYTMGGLWVDYDLMSNIPGLFVLGEANFSDHGANRLGASALMQGLADGYFVIPYTIGGYLAGKKPAAVGPDHAACRDAVREAEERIKRLLALRGKKSLDDCHRELGLLMWEKCGMGRNEARLKEAQAKIPELAEAFWKDATLLGGAMELNQSLEYAGRMVDFFELASLIARDALDRRESCGCHFREESQTEDNEAKRDDANFAYVAAWEWKGDPTAPNLVKEPLTFENVKPATRSYK